MNAQDFAASLGVPVERSPRTDHCALTKYRDGHYVISVPKKLDLDTVEGQRLAWHEVAHFLDKAHYFGGHSQITALINIGELSSKYAAALTADTDYILKYRVKPELILKVRSIGKKFTRLDDLLADPDVPERSKLSIAHQVNRWEYDKERYLRQGPELFAEGFAEYMTHRDRMRRDAPKLYAAYEELFQEHPLLRAQDMLPWTETILMKETPTQRTVRRAAPKRRLPSKSSPASLSSLR